MSSVQCHSLSVLNYELESMRGVLILPESEESWETIAKGIIRMTGLCNNGALNFPDDLVLGIRTFSRPLISAMSSERSRLSGAAIDLLHTLACGLGNDAEPLISIFIPTLITLCTRTNKVFITRARTCILAFIEHTQLPAILPFLAEASKDKSVTLRIVAAECVLACLNCFNPPDLERESRAKAIEGIIRLTAKDASADVRKLSRKVFEAYKALMPGRVDKFIGPLTPIIKKYLEIKTLPTTSAPQTGPLSATSSVPAGALVNGPRSTQAKRSRTEQVMPPPDYIPTRPPAVDVRNGAGDRESTLSKHHGSSRPPSVLQKTEDKLVSTAPEAARRNLHREPSSTTIVPSGGANRVNRIDTHPTRSNGPVRRLPTKPQTAVEKHKSTESDAEHRSCVTGGARRVPLPSSSSLKADDASVKEVPNSADFVSKPGNTVDPAATLSRSAPSRLAGAKRGQNKANEIPKPVINSALTVARPSSTQPATNPTRPDKQPIRKPDKKPNVTQPTLAQLSRAKAAAADRKEKETGKPAWGRTKSASTVKGSSVAGKIEKASRSKAPTDPVVVVPKDIPLPPSPKPNDRSSPASIALPPSPIVEVQMEAAEATTVGPTVEDHLRVNEAEQPAVPLIPQIQCPPTSTPTLLLNDLAAPTGTPISSLLSSIQQGFLFTPCSPLSPPQSYLPLDNYDDSDSPTPFTKMGGNYHGLSGKRMAGWSGLGVATREEDDENGRQVLSDMEMN